MYPLEERINLQTQWKNDIPLKFLWVIQFEPRRAGTSEAIGKAINKVLTKYERRTSEVTAWPVVEKLMMNQSGRAGYLFASNIAFPGDSFQISDSTIDAIGGLIPGYFAGARAGYASSNKLDITFTETNIDVLDYFLRPWILAASHKGLIEDGNVSEDIKCHINIGFYTRTKVSNPVVQIKSDKDSQAVANSATFQLRKRMQFYNAVPFNIAGDQISYGDLTDSDIKKIVSFAFSHYETIGTDIDYNK